MRCQKPQCRGFFCFLHKMKNTVSKYALVFHGASAHRFLKHRLMCAVHFKTDRTALTNQIQLFPLVGRVKIKRDLLAFQLESKAERLPFQEK